MPPKNTKKYTYIPLQVMWEHLNINPTDISPIINIFQYITTCLNEINIPLPRAQNEINFLQKIIKENEAIGWMNGFIVKWLRRQYVDLVMACAKNNIDKLEDYFFFVEDVGNTNGNYYRHDDYLTSLINMINCLMVSGNKEERLNFLISTLKDACVREKSFDNIKDLLSCTNLIDSWKTVDERNDIIKSLLRNQWEQSKRFTKGRNFLKKASIKEFFNEEFFKQSVNVLGEEILEDLKGIATNINQPNLSRSEVYALLTISRAFSISSDESEVESLKMLWPDRSSMQYDKSYFRKIDELLTKVKEGGVAFKELINHIDSLSFSRKPFSEAQCKFFDDFQVQSIIEHYMNDPDGIANAIDHFVNNLHNASKNKTEQMALDILKSIGNKKNYLFENLEYDTRKKLVVFFSNNKLSISLFSCLLKGLNNVQADELIKVARECESLDEMFLSLLPGSSKPALSINATDELLLNFIVNEGFDISLALAQRPPYFSPPDRLDSEAMQELSKIPFALAVAVLNSRKPVPVELIIFNKKFQKVNNRVTEQYVIDPGEFSIKYSPKLVNLYELLETQLFSLMTSKLITSTIALSKFLDNYDYLSPKVYTPLIQRLLVLMKKKEESVFLDILLMLSQHSSLVDELRREKNTNYDVDSLIDKSLSLLNEEGVNLDKILNLLIKEVSNIFQIILDIPAYESINISKLIENKEVLGRLLIGRKYLKFNSFSHVLDRMLIEDFKENGSFANFVSDTEQSDLLGRRLAEFNQAVVVALEKNNINSELAINYPIKYQFDTRLQDQVDIPQLCTAVWNDLLNLESAMKNIARSENIERFSRIINIINKVKKEVTKGNKGLNVQRLLNQSLQIHFKNIQSTIKKMQEHVMMTPEIIEHAGHFAQRSALLLEASSSKKHSKVVQVKKFTIQQVDKNDVNTLILGDQLSCCLAPDGGQFQAIVQRRLDKAMMFHVVIDEEVKQPVCGNWLFLAYNKNKPQDVYVVANFYEIRAGYGMKCALRDRMVAELTEYTAQYANAIGAKGYLIRPLTYGLIPDFTASPSYKDKCQLKQLEIEKIGGYFDPRGLDIARDADGLNDFDNLYYLDAIHLSKFHLYSSPQSVPIDTAFYKKSKGFAVEKTLFFNKNESSKKGESVDSDNQQSQTSSDLLNKK